MRPVFADPKTDVIFKKIFGEKAHKGLVGAIVDLCDVLGLQPTDEQRAGLKAMDLTELEALRQHLKARRSWP